MLFKLSALAALVPFAVALQLQAPTNVHVSGPITINWTADPSDNVFTIELHHPSFNNDLALVNNVNPGQGTVTQNVGQVPAQDGYTLLAVNIGNITDIFATSPSFSIGPQISSSSSSSSTASGSGTASGTASGSATTPLGVSTQSTTAFGVTNSNSAAGTNTASGSGSGSGANTASGSGTQTASGSGSSPSNLNGGNGAISASFSSAAGLLGAVAAVAVFVL